jgi:hypothetical protein
VVEKWRRIIQRHFTKPEVKPAAPPPDRRAERPDRLSGERGSGGFRLGRGDDDDADDEDDDDVNDD